MSKVTRVSPRGTVSAVRTGTPAKQPPARTRTTIHRTGEERARPTGLTAPAAARPGDVEREARDQGYPQEPPEAASAAANYDTVAPPSITSVVPVTNDAASLSRNTAPPAISGGWA